MSDMKVRDATNWSGPDVGCFWGFGIMFAIVLIVSVLVRLFWR